MNALRVKNNFLQYAKPLAAASFTSNWLWKLCERAPFAPSQQQQHAHKKHGHCMINKQIVD